MATDGLLRAVRGQLGLGRLVAVGDAADGTWLSERAAARVLGAAAAGVAGLKVTGLRLALAGPAALAEPTVPPPPGALPPGPLRIEATCAAALHRPLPRVVAELRAALGAAAHARLGLPVAAVDVHVADLLGEAEPAEAAEAAERTAHGADSEAGDGDEAPGDDPGPVAAAVRAVPGVRGLSGALGGAFRTPDITDSAAPPGRLVRLRLTVGAGHRVLDVARAARRAAAEAAAPGAPGPVTVSLLVADVVP